LVTVTVTVVEPTPHSGGGGSASNEPGGLSDDTTTVGPGEFGAVELVDDVEPGATWADATGTTAPAVLANSDRTSDANRTQSTENIIYSRRLISLADAKRITVIHPRHD